MRFQIGVFPMFVRKFKKKSCIIILLFNICFIGVILISSYNTTNHLRRLKYIQGRLPLSNGKKHQTSSTLISAEYKRPGENVILFWTTYFNENSKDAWKKESPKLKLDCFTECRMVFDRSLLGISDAVVFHSRDLRTADFPAVHPKQQIWVYLQQESPVNTKEDLDDYTNTFNWTMTYRRDSDVYHPYGKVVPLEDSNLVNPVNYQEIISHKTKLVAWVVSNCQTNGKREEYVDELQNFIDVDIYGMCGNYSCPLGNECFQEIERDYKFYLSFENSLCKDYVTEKFFETLQLNLVPIVYGGGDYASIAPPFSYININDFVSPKALAEYLYYLNANPEKYLQYFLWKSQYKVIKQDGWCTLCHRIIEHKKKPVSKVYRNLKEWWYSSNYPINGIEGEESRFTTGTPGVRLACKEAEFKITTNFFKTLWKNLKYGTGWLYNVFKWL